ncbi:MAG: YlxR family protein [Deltaproteobacteria bacterium]|nr:YlxR family protein [Deltaproteobacteria bacterium]
MAKRSQRHIPQRTCISCRERRGKKELIRLVLNAKGMAVWDEYGKGQGRGAYVCPMKPCLEKIEKGNRLNRAFRKKGPISLHPEFLMTMDERGNA